MRRFSLLFACALAASALGAAEGALVGAASPLTASPQAAEGASLAGLAGRFSAVLAQAALEPTPSRLALVVLLLGVLPFAFAPMTLLTLGAAAAFRPAVAAPVIMGGLLLNTALAWLLARSVVGARLEAWLERRGGALGAIREGARRDGLKWAILCRYVPAPFVAQPMVLASTGVGLGTTVLGSFIGMLPWVGAYVWVAKAGRQGSLRSLGLAFLGLAAAFLLASWLRKRYATPPATALLRPRDPALPCLTLYTVPGQELSDEARAELGALRDRLHFEVDEQSLGAGADPQLRELYEDHAPVALFDGHKLFNFKMDENVLRVRLVEWHARKTAGAA
jgi:uncharacterized membrane protein YdjX (TVP38/TMEM64 family)